MSTLQQEVYEAFRAIDVPEDKALKAAAALSASAGPRLVRIESDIAILKHDVALLKWATATNTALLIGVLVKLFIH
jgi:hypothetical protein